jgi:hypothetical protein
MAQDLIPITVNRPKKIGIAISNIKAEKVNVEREIALLQREQERLFKTLMMLEKLEDDKLSI